MSIGSTNYLSPSEIMLWLSEKTEHLYGQMTEAMDTQDTRSDLESDLNKLKADMGVLQHDGSVSTKVQQEMAHIMETYKDEDVNGTLKGMNEQLLGAPGQAVGYADDWQRQVGDRVDALGKKDQLGLITVQDLNAHVNEAKQLASNLLDAMNRSDMAIIQNIKA